MKETEFIDQNKRKWQEFEEELDKNIRQPNRITNHYMETVEDLSHARTHYPNRLVRSYLNGITQFLSLRIHKSKIAKWRDIKKFWKIDLPLAMFESRKQFLLSFVILVLSMAIGVLSSIYNPEFAKYILGSDYVDMTIENIEKGDPMAVYKDKQMGNMFLRITFNNLLVAARTFIMGLFFGVGTLMILLYNGVMLGVFQFFFFERGLFFESFLTIWQHGVIEISSIVLAGAAGLVLAKGVLFPGTYSRLDAFRLAGRKSLMLMLGLMPLLVYSGLVEAFITRLTDMHWIIRLSAILLSVAFVLAYFVWYPRRVAKKHRIEDELKTYIQPIKTSHFAFDRIEKNFTIIWEAIRQLLKQRKRWFITGGLLVVISSVAKYISLEELADIMIISNISDLTQVWSFFGTGDSLFYTLLNALIISLAWITAAFNIHNKGIDNGENWKKKTLTISITGLIIGLLLALCFTNGWMVLASFFFLPILGTMTATVSTSGGMSFIADGFNHTINKSSLAKIYGLTAVFVVMYGFIIGLVNNLVLNLTTQGLVTLFGMDLYSTTFYIARTALLVFILFTIYSTLFSTLGLAYFSLLEILSAKSLEDKVNEAFPLQSEPNEGVNIVKPSNIHNS